MKATCSWTHWKQRHVTPEVLLHMQLFCPRCVAWSLLAKLHYENLLPSTSVTSTVQRWQRTFVVFNRHAVRCQTQWPSVLTEASSVSISPPQQIPENSEEICDRSLPWSLPSFSWWSFHLLDVFSILMAVNIPVLVFWVMTPCSLVGWYDLRGPSCLLRNVWPQVGGGNQ